MTKTTETLFGEACLGELGAVLDRLESGRVLVLTGTSRRFVAEVLAGVGDRPVEVFAGAEVHVPRAVVDAAAARLDGFGADTLIAVGGGAATGLGKALALEHDVRFVAVPTTYSGSEMTNIFGVTSEDGKKTGRTDRVRPDVVFYDPRLTRELPLRLTVQSLLNALAHPISALSTGALDGDSEREALAVIDRLCRVIEQLLRAPRRVAARLDALRAASRAARVLDRAKLGPHHELAHFLGGRFALEHSGLHAVLLAHTVADLHRERPALYQRVASAAGFDDLPAALFDALLRAGAVTSLRALGLERGALAAALAERDIPLGRVVWSAFHGRRPSVHVRLEGWGLREPVSVSGPPLEQARKVVVALHGRGASADGWLRQVEQIGGDARDLAVVAPQAPDNAWYEPRFDAPLSALGDALEVALGEVERVVARVLEAVPQERVIVMGFSQGACLAAEYVARSGRVLGGLVALAGARIGDPSMEVAPRFSAMPVLLGASVADPWVGAAAVERTARFFTTSGAHVTVESAPGDEHTITALQRIAARELLLGRSTRGGLQGFDNAHQSETLPGALPSRQNSPRKLRYGLYAEQVNATGFGAARAHNVRGWLYRVRPSAQHSAFRPVEHPRLVGEFSGARPDPNLSGWAPLPIPDAPTDFVDGLATFGGAGSPSSRRGFAIHLYVANRSMEHRAFYDADGELLLVPQLGGLTLLTELGVLDVEPGQIAIVPRGLKFSVLLRDGSARGYVAEVFGRRFELPDRGPVGANGLTDPRHFRAPEAWHEDRLALGFRVTVKLGGALFEAKQAYSPYDVVAWHGNYAPYVYDLESFSPVSNVLFDHPDPSIYTVLSAPLDERGANTLDFVFFPPRWDATEHTFRPPFFHRNATTEFNGVIRDPHGDEAPFFAGGCFLTPSMTAHGVLERTVERVLRQTDEAAERPQRFKASAMWFQFETAMPISVTRWAETSDHRIDDWQDGWGAYRSRFSPRSSDPGAEG